MSQPPGPADQDLLTFISILTLALYGQIKGHRDWILSSGGHTAVLAGGLLEVIVALAGIGTAVTLYPVLKRHILVPGGASQPGETPSA